MRATALLLLCTIVLTLPLSGDKITLENGNTVSGTILSQNKRTITLKTPYGNLTWKKIKVKRIEYEGRRKSGPPANVYTTHLLVHRGRLIRQDADTLEIRNNQDKKVIIPMKDITQVNWSPKPQLVYRIGTNMKPGSLWRSALYPGWGQFYHNRKKMGYCLAIGFGALALTTLTTRLRYNDLLGDYNALGYDDRDLRARTDRWRTTYNISLVGMALVYLYNLADAVIFAPGEKTRTYRFAVLPEAGGPKMILRNSWRF